MGTRLTGKTAVVVGGGAHSERVFGIGESTCRRFADEGCTVVVADVSEAMAQRTVDQIEADGGPQAHAVEVDLTVEADIEDLAALCAERFDSVDAVVNNAGIRITPGPVTESTTEDWQSIFEVNLKGIADCCKHLVPVLAETGGGSVVNVSSANAQLGRKNWALYDATKAGLLGLTRDMACDHAEDDVRVNAVLPGPTLTDYHLERHDVTDVDSVVDEGTTPQPDGPGILKRRAHPEELANAILFLASPESSFITGTSINVDGGLTAAGYDV